MLSPEQYLGSEIRRRFEWVVLIFPQGLGFDEESNHGGECLQLAKVRGWENGRRSMRTCSNYH
jgi:hypothetical protein